MAPERHQQGNSKAMNPDFIALRATWQAFSEFFQKTAHVPKSAAEFEAKYGVFTDSATLEQFAANCNVANACAAALGDAEQLQQQLARGDSQLLESDGTPLSIYGEITRLLLRVQNLASTFCATLQNLEDLLSPQRGRIEQRSENLKQVLVGNDGLVPVIVALKAKTLMLDQKIKPLRERLQAANEAISGTDVLSAANQRIGYLESKLAEKKAPLAQAKKEWDSALFGKDGKRKKYEALLEEYNALQLDYDLKNQFVTDADNIFAAGTAAVLGVATVENQVEKIGKVMADARSLLMSVCTAANAEQLADYKWVSKALGLQEYFQFWSQLNKEAQEFTQAALV